MCERDEGDVGEFYMCPSCGSENVNVEIYSGTTGVVAPDGGHEYATEEYLECRDCGCKEGL